jgi:hypothetical protein
VPARPRSLRSIEAPIEASVLNSLTKVLRSDLAGLPKIRDRSGDLQDAVVRPRREAESVHGFLEEVRASCINLTIRIAEEPSASPEPPHLDLAGRHNPLPDDSRRLTRRLRRQFCILHGRHFNQNCPVF